MNTTISFSFTATAALLLGTIFLGEVTAHRIPERLAVPLDKIPAEMAGWRASSDKELPARTLQVLDATSYLSRPYQKDSQDLDLFIAFYAQQRAGESMHSPKHCLPGSGWEIWKHDSAWIPFVGGQVQVNKYSIQNAGTRMLMFYWYQSKTRIIASEYSVRSCWPGIRSSPGTPRDPSSGSPCLIPRGPLRKESLLPNSSFLRCNAVSVIDVVDSARRPPQPEITAPNPEITVPLSPYFGPRRILPPQTVH